jgi:hypothetical protein
MAMTFERSPDTDAVIDALRGCNNEISYRDLARQSGLTLGRAKQVLASARRALRADKILFGTIRGEGLRRLTDSDKVKKPEAFKKRVFRGAGRELKDLATIANFGALEKVEQHSCTINRTVLNVLRQQARVKPEVQKTDITPQPMANVSRLIQAKIKL